MNERWPCHPNATPNSFAAFSATHCPRKHVSKNEFQDLGVPCTPQHDPENFMHTPEVNGDQFLAGVLAVKSAHPGLQLSSFMEQQLKRLSDGNIHENDVKLPASSYTDLHNAGRLSTCFSDKPVDSYSSLPSLDFDEGTSEPATSPLTLAIHLQRSLQAIKCSVGSHERAIPISRSIIPVLRRWALAF